MLKIQFLKRIKNQHLIYDTDQKAERPSTEKDETSEIYNYEIVLLS